MRRQALAIALMFAAPSRGAEVVVEGRTFRVPDGLIVEKVAGPPLVDRPIVADFDERGRLYVADSSGSNEPVKQQLEARPHRVVRLEDSDGDGRFDRSTVFADRMMFPEGAMWLDGSLYVAAPPSIWKLTDLDGDGVADRREEWFAGKTLTGCANDLHGPYAGPDGWIYWCKGAFAPQTHDRPGRKPLETRAAHIFRARADGTGIEPVMTGGMDNPVDVAFTAGGERIFTTTFLQHPGGGRRDGLIHALYGGVYGKVHDVIDGHPRTGPGVLPPLVHLGPAAPAGLARAESDALGSRDALFAACFNLRKVTRHALTPLGGSFEASTDDLLATEDHDFHPTDVQEDADGSLLVVNTGGWYKLCCPTSQLVKPDVLGGIYRVRRRDAPRLDDPRGLKLAWDTTSPEGLASLLDDPRPAVRRRAVSELGKKGEVAIPAIWRTMQAERSPEARRNAVWAACRIDAPWARTFARLVMDLPDGDARQAAIHAAGLWRDRAAWPKLVEVLKGSSIAARRASAEALGRIGEPLAIPAILGAASAEDWALRHSLTYALIEIDDPVATAAGLTLLAPPARRAAMVALDQMEGGGLKLSQVREPLTAPDPADREVAWWIAGRHPEWGSDLASILRGRLMELGRSPEDREEVEGQLARLAGSRAIGDLIADRLVDPSTPPEARRVVLRAMARSGLKEVPAAWADSLVLALGGGDDATTRQAVATARALPIRPGSSRPLAQALARVAGQEGLPAEVRIEALAAVPGGLPAVEPASFGFLLAQVGGDRPVASRSAAAEILAKARLDRDQLDRLAGAVAGAGPIEVGRLLDAFDKADGEEVGLRLVDALMRSPARPSLRPEALRPRLARFGPRVAREAKALYEAIEADTAGRRGRLEALLSGLSGGDVRRGQQVFNGPKAACASCHAIGYVGGKLGPDLTRIGQVRDGRDLLESIAFPSASFVRSYEPVSVSTRDGRAFSGILRRDDPDEIVLAVAADREERIPRDRVEEVTPGTVSVMPAGLDLQLSRGELADLIAFLKACR